MSFTGSVNFQENPILDPALYSYTPGSCSLKEELDSMDKAGVIVKVTGPTDWVNALVVVETLHWKAQGMFRP